MPNLDRPNDVAVPGGAGSKIPVPWEDEGIKTRLFDRQGEWSLVVADDPVF